MNVSNGLIHRFKERCLPILHDECKQFKEVSGAAHPCLKYGMVLCKGSGLVLWRLRNNFLKLMERQFQPETELRLDLGRHSIVVHCIGTRAAIHNPWFRRDALRLGHPVDAVRCEKWLSIADMSFSPYAPSFYVLSAREAAANDPVVPCDVIRLQTTGGVFLAEFKNFRTMDRSLDWTAQWYKIWSSNAVVANFLPGNIHVRAVSEPIPFWPKLPKPTPKPGMPHDSDFDGDVPALLDAGDDEAKCDDPDDPPQRWVRYATATRPTRTTTAMMTMTKHLQRVHAWHGLFLKTTRRFHITAVAASKLYAGILVMSHAAHAN